MRTGVEVATRIRPGAVTGHFGERAGASEVEIRGCTFIPGQTGAELVGDRDTVISDAQLVCPSGTDLLATDRIRVRGVVWLVNGDPSDYWNKRGIRKAMIANLTKVTG